MVVMFVGKLCSGRRYFPYYSYRRNPTGREFFVPAGTLIAVKLLMVLMWGVVMVRNLVMGGRLGMLRRA